MDAALKSIGAVSFVSPSRPWHLHWKQLSKVLSNIDQTSLNSFSTALHSITSDPDIINVITSHASAAAVPTLAVAMNRRSYSSANDAFSLQGYDMTEDSAQNTHVFQPPLSPRLHSLPDNVLSPLGLLAEASLQNTDNSKRQRLAHFGKSSHRPSPLSLDTSRPNSHVRNGSITSTSSYRMATSAGRGGNAGDEDEHGDGGVASQNYFKPGMCC